MSDVGAVAKLLSKLAEIFTNRPKRLLIQALDAAKEYMAINETNKHRGRKLTPQSKTKWLKHYKKQVDAWS